MPHRRAWPGASVAAAVLRLTQGATAEHLQVVQDHAEPAVSATDSTINRVHATGAADAGTAITVRNSIVRNTVALASNRAGRALVARAGTVSITNSTLIATGAEGTALDAEAHTVRVEVTARNVIARGDRDVVASSSGATSR